MPLLNHLAIDRIQSLASPWYCTSWNKVQTESTWFNSHSLYNPCKTWLHSIGWYSLWSLRGEGYKDNRRKNREKNSFFAILPRTGSSSCSGNKFLAVLPGFYPICKILKKATSNHNNMFDLLSTMFDLLSAMFDLLSSIFDLLSAIFDLLSAGNNTEAQEFLGRGGQVWPMV